MFKRIGLFIVTNLAITLTIGIVWGILQATGVLRNVEQLGSYGPLLVYSALFGIGKVVLGETAAGLGLLALAAVCFAGVMRNLRR